jgi:hypothetical protein
MAARRPGWGGTPLNPAAGPGGIAGLVMRPGIGPGFTGARSD